MSVPATKSAQQLEHKKAEDLAVELAKKSRQQDYEYQEMLDKMKTEFFAIYDKTKEDKEKEIVEEHVHLGDFEKLRTLGSGSFGVVILVKNTNSNEFFAMKAMDKQRIIKLKQLEHSLNEKKILEAIRFPFLVNMEFFFKDNSFIYMIMPFVNGGEMFTHLRRLKRFDEQLAKFYAAQVVLGLEYLHNLDIVYRDLKPENILLDAKGYLKIGDMGFCKIVKGRAWTLCGTPEYIAPEIILSRGYGKSVDWWSFGILIYEMNAGLPPFVSTDPMILYEKIVAGKFRFYAHFTSELKDLIKNILQVDLSRRYGNLKNGVYDIKSHRWFRDTSWVNIYNRKVAPIYKPIVRTTGDATNFDNMLEEPLIVSAEDRYEQEFQDF